MSYSHAFSYQAVRYDKDGQLNGTYQIIFIYTAHIELNGVDYQSTRYKSLKHFMSNLLSNNTGTNLKQKI